MNRASYIMWLAEEAFSGLSYLWPVTAALVLLFAGALFWDVRRARLMFTSRLVYLLLPGVGILLILLAGGLFERRSGLAFLPYIGFGVGLLLAIVTVIRLRPAWMTAVSSSLCLLWYSIWCWFVSVMSITGDWL